MSPRLSLRRAFGLRAFRSDVRGAIGVVFGLTLVPMLLAVGFAVDFSRTALVRSELQRAGDAAALAAAQAQAHGQSDLGQLTALARRVFEADFRVDGFAAFDAVDLKVEPRDGGLGIGIEAKTRVETTIMNITGISSIEVAAASHAVLDKRDFEIAMMFDVTGSMNDAPARGGPAKIQSLKGAATAFVDTLMPAAGRYAAGRVRIATVPFSQGVNAGAAAASVTAGRSSSCVVERNGMGATDDLSPRIAPLVRPVDMACPRSIVRPLSDSRTDVLGAVSALQATGYTAGHIGTAWAWYVLSPNWNAVWPASAAASGTGVRKIAVLMTDGLYNTIYEAGVPAEDARARVQANARAVALCRGMKTEGIVIYTIGFDVVDPTVRTTLRDCASDVADGRGGLARAYFDAADGAALKAAYDEIARQIRDNLRLAG